MIKTLIVDKTHLICNLIAAVLNEEPDIKVVGCATTVEDALDRAYRADVILISVKLPGHGALKLVRALVEADLSIKILVTGLAESEPHILPYIEAGADGYVGKQDSVDDLLESIRAVPFDRMSVSPEIAAALISRVNELAQQHHPARGGPNGAADLTPREREVLEFLAQRLTNREIADRLFIELGTVKNHVHSILTKLEVNSRHEAAAYARAYESSLRPVASD